jgi:hypothetical protein
MEPTLEQMGRLRVESGHYRVAREHWACSRSDIDWKAEGIRSSALEFVAYSLGFFHDGGIAPGRLLRCTTTPDIISSV